MLNGAKLLLENGFSATAVLRTMEVFRLFPSLAGVVDNRLVLAGAMAGVLAGLWRRNRLQRAQAAQRS